MYSFVVKYKRVFTDIMAILFAVLAAFPLFAIRDAKMEDASSLLAAWNGNSVGAFCVVVAAFLIYRRVLAFESRRVKCLAIVAAAILALCHQVGYHMSRWDSLWNEGQNAYAIAFELSLLLGTFLEFYAGLSILFQYLLVKQEQDEASQRHSVILCCSWPSFFIVSGILLAFWAIYYGIFFPGIVTWDSYYQIEQGMGYHPLTDEHPFLHTLIVGAVIRLGTAIFGTIPGGIALYTAFQAILISFVVSYIMTFMAKRGIRLTYRIGVLIFFALHPVIAAYSFTQWKDIWIAYILLLYIVFLLEISINHHAFFRSKLRIGVLITIIFGFLMTKGTGIVILVITLPFLWICARKHYKKMLVITCICFGLFGIVRTILLPALDIDKGHIREPLSVPLQQIARVVTKHGNDLTEEQRQTISEILPYEKLPSLYTTWLSDAVKSELNEEVFRKDIGKYAKCWLELGIKHPKTYLESFLANSYGYWYPETTYWQISSHSYYRIINMYRENNWEIYDPNVDKYPKEPISEGRRIDFVNQYDALRGIPGLSMVFSLGAYFWLALVLVFLCILKKKYRLLLPFAVLLAVFITCITSPVFAEFRYAFTVLIACPVLIPFVLQDRLHLTDKMGIERTMDRDAETATDDQGMK